MCVEKIIFFVCKFERTNSFVHRNCNSMMILRMEAKNDVIIIVGQMEPSEELKMKVNVRKQKVNLISCEMSFLLSIASNMIIGRILHGHLKFASIMAW